MSEPRTLSADQLRFINLVAARKFTDREPETADRIDAVIAGVSGETAFVRAAALVSALLGERVFTVVPQPTALLAMTVQLSLEGYELLAPQGAAAGMIAGVANGREDLRTVARWLEDRCVNRGAIS